MRAGSRAASDGSLVPASALAEWRVHVTSRNTFPTAAGLASSAAGYACLVSALAQVYAVVVRVVWWWWWWEKALCATSALQHPPHHQESYPGELSTLARQGSGSACRSLYGGFVEWSMGTRVDGRDSLAKQVASEGHWPELCLLIAVVSDAKKDTGSTDGMVRSVATSELLHHR